jgi:tetratricopeptide (TPR) repeat protein
VTSHRAVALLGLAGLLAGGCATTQELTRDVPGTKFVKYTIAGADREQRAGLERGLSQLRAAEYDAAARSLRQAAWDVEQIDKPWLRLEELVEVHEALADAYTGLGKTQWSEEQRAMAQALIEYGRRETKAGSPDAVLSKARGAYQTAHFREAVTALSQALVELEGLSPTPARLKALVDARCHLMLAYFALGRADRAGEEVRHLAASDGAIASCNRQAPPPVRTFIRSIETTESRFGKRSAE